MPRRLTGIPIRNLLFNRAICTALPPYYTSRSCQGGRGAPTGLRAALLRPFKRAVWWALEEAAKSVFHLKDDQVPAISLPSDLFVGGQVGRKRQCHTVFRGINRIWGGRRWARVRLKGDRVTEAHLRESNLFRMNIIVTESVWTTGQFSQSQRWHPSHSTCLCSHSYRSWTTGLIGWWRATVSSLSEVSSLPLLL